MAEAKHSFVDDYPYLMYTNEDTLVYSNKTDTSIEDLPSGGQEYTITCVELEGGTPVEITSIIKLAKYNMPPDDNYSPIGDPLTSANAGTLLYCSEESILITDSLDGENVTMFPVYKNALVMPSCDIFVMKVK